MSKSNIKNSTLAMRSRFSLVLVLGLSPLLLFASGCRTTSDNQIDLLERELRVREDYIYELEDHIVEYSEKLRNCRSCASPQQMANYTEEVDEPEPAPRRKKKTTRRKAKREKSIIDDNRGNEEALMPAPEQNEPEDISPEDIVVPDDIDIEMSDPEANLREPQTVQQAVAIGPEDSSSDAELLLIPDPVNFTDSDDPLTMSEEQYADAVFNDEQVEAASASVERTVKRLEVTQLFHGAGSEDSPLNLLTVVEALDDNGEPVDLDGEVSLMVMTAGDEVSPRRLKRWNFTKDETLAAWQSSDLGDGLHLELPLEATELPGSPLELWVRLVTSDGRKLLAQLPFKNNQLINIVDNIPKPMPAGLTRAELAEAGNYEELPAEELIITESTAEEIATLDDEIEYETDIQNEQTDSRNDQSATEERALIAQRFEPKNPDKKVEATTDTNVKTTSGSQTKWRSATRSTARRATKSFSTTSPKSTRWSTQAPNRQAKPLPKKPVASRSKPAAQSTSRY